MGLMAQKSNQLTCKSSEPPDLLNPGSKCESAIGVKGREGVVIFVNSFVSDHDLLKDGLSCGKKREAAGIITFEIVFLFLKLSFGKSFFFKDIFLCEHVSGDAATFTFL